MRRTALAAVGILAALSLVACGEGDKPNAPEATAEAEQTEAAQSHAPNEGGPAIYLYGDMYGAMVTVDLTAEHSDELTTEANAVRELQGHEPLTWYKVEVDNTEGSETFHLMQIQAVTKDGETIEGVIGSDNLPELPEMDGEDGLYNRNVYAHNAFIDAYPDGLAGSKGSTAVTFDGLDPSDIRYLYVNGEPADPN